MKAVAEEKLGRIKRAGRFIRRHRLYYSGVAVTVVLAGFVGYGLGSRWGAGQWGPLSGWVAGSLTLAAIVVALRESIRSQIERDIDLELDRRRECIRALSDVWAAVTEMRALTLDLAIFFAQADFYEDDDAVIRKKKVTEKRLEFSIPFQASYMKARFYADPILHDTALASPLKSLHMKLVAITEESGKLFNIAIDGIPPTMRDEVNELWEDVREMRSVHLKLTRESFSLDRNVVRSELRRRRRGGH
ncbi:hypothetical protein EV589_2194 [Mycobacterium sp. BK558]|nr:hypothetical protein EV589_2194 [Mycobacterium sp. BK558]